MEVLVVPAAAGPFEGAEVVRKTASLPGERDRLLREAEVLRVAAERGVPGLPALVTPPSPGVAEPCLVTTAASGPSLAVAGPLPILEVAGVAAEVARLLGCLHEAGLVHGSVEPSHVVLDGAGGVILVGLGDGGPAGARTATGVAGPLDPADDVAGWGQLVGQLLDRAASGDDEPLDDLRHALSARRVRRAGRRLPPPRSTQDERRVLAAVADQAQDPDPARRPSARSLAAALTHRVPAARIPGGAAPVATPASGLLERLAAHLTPAPAPAADGPPLGVATTPPVEQALEGDSPTRRRPRPASRRTSAAALPVLVPSGRALPAEPQRPAGGLAVPASPAFTTGPRAAGPDEPADAPRRSGSAARRRWAVVAVAAGLVAFGVPAAMARLHAPGRPGPSAGGPLPPSTRGGCHAVTPPAADVDGDGCDEPVALVDGVLRVGSARFALGDPGDAWAVGDWDCDGRRTLALLHQGAVAVFDGWPGPGGELQGRPVAGAAGASALAVTTGPDGCDRLAVGQAGSTDLVVVDGGRVP